jgi:hypothetical protein
MVLDQPPLLPHEVYLSRHCCEAKPSTLSSISVLILVHKDCLTEQTELLSVCCTRSRCDYWEWPGFVDVVERVAEIEQLTSLLAVKRRLSALILDGKSRCTHLRARVLRLFRFKRLTRFFLHFALIFGQV